MNVLIYDPLPMGNEYCTRMFLQPFYLYLRNNSINVSMINDLSQAKGSHVVLLTDHLSEARIDQLKNSGNKIIGINVIDSSHISIAISHAKNLALVDCMFMISGIQLVNKDTDFTIDSDFKLIPYEKQFLAPHDWAIYSKMRDGGQLHSLPYVPWIPITDPKVIEPWGRRSQKAILRGGGHSRRFITALFLMLVDRLDPNSGFVLNPYFADDMAPQFRYCGTCVGEYKIDKRALYIPGRTATGCNSPARIGNASEWSMENLGHWNNRCPRSFFWMAEQFMKRYGKIDMQIVEKMLNARWLTPQEHMDMLGHILFSSDLKWIHSIYQPQRFWEAAAAGCINVLPQRTASQSYFPITTPGQHYLLFDESMNTLDEDFRISEPEYNDMAKQTRELFDKWIQPTVYAINTNLMTYMLGHMTNV